MRSIQSRNAPAWRFHSLDDMVRAMRRHVEQGIDTGRVVAFKSSHAYFGPVGVGERNRSDAERAFERLVISDPTEGLAIRGECMGRYPAHVAESKASARLSVPSPL